MSYETAWDENIAITQQKPYFDPFSEPLSSNDLLTPPVNGDHAFDLDFSPEGTQGLYGFDEFVPEFDAGPLGFYDSNVQDHSKISPPRPSGNRSPLNASPKVVRKMRSQTNLAAVEGLGIAEPLEPLQFVGSPLGSPNSKLRNEPRVSKQSSRSNLTLKQKKSRVNLTEIELSPALSELDQNQIRDQNQNQNQSQSQNQSQKSVDTSSLDSHAQSHMTQSHASQTLDAPQGLPQLNAPYVHAPYVHAPVHTPQGVPGVQGVPQGVPIPSYSPSQEHLSNMPVPMIPAQHTQSMPMPSRSPGLHTMRSMPQMRNYDIPYTPYQQRPTRGKAAASPSMQSPIRQRRMTHNSQPHQMDNQTPNHNHLVHPDTPTTILAPPHNSQWIPMGPSPTPAARFNSRAQLLSTANDQSPAKGMWHHEKQQFNFPPPVPNPSPRKAASTNSLRRATKKKPNEIPEMQAAMGEFQVELKPKRSFRKSLVPKQLRHAFRSKNKVNNNVPQMLPEWQVMPQVPFQQMPMHMQGMMPVYPPMHPNAPMHMQMHMHPNMTSPMAPMTPMVPGMNPGMAPQVRQMGPGQMGPGQMGPMRPMRPRMAQMQPPMQPMAPVGQMAPLGPMNGMPYTGHPVKMSPTKPRMRAPNMQPPTQHVQPRPHRQTRPHYRDPAPDVPLQMPISMQQQPMTYPSHPIIEDNDIDESNFDHNQPHNQQQQPITNEIINDFNANTHDTNETEVTTPPLNTDILTEHPNNHPVSSSSSTPPLSHESIPEETTVDLAISDVHTSNNNSDKSRKSTESTNTTTDPHSSITHEQSVQQSVQPVHSQQQHEHEHEHEREHPVTDTELEHNLNEPSLSHLDPHANADDWVNFDWSLDDLSANI